MSNVAKDLEAAFKQHEESDAAQVIIAEAPKGAQEEIPQAAEANISEEPKKATEKENITSESDRKDFSTNKDKAEKASKATEPKKPLLAPNSWSAEDKAWFQKLSPEVQEITLRREKERDKAFNQKTEELAKSRKKYEELEEVVSPYIEKMQLAGTTPGQLVGQLLAAQTFLDRDPAEGLKWLAQSYGLNLSDLVNQPSQDIDPKYQTLQTEVQTLKQHLMQQQQAAQHGYVKSLEQELNDFISEKDSSGTPLRPHMEQVGNDMVPIVQHLKRQNPSWSNKEVLAKAYEKAVRMNDEVWSQELERMDAEKEARRIEETKQKVQKAKAASVSITGAPTVGSAEKEPSSVRAMLEKAWNQHA